MWEIVLEILNYTSEETHEGGKTFKIQNTQVNTEQKENKFQCDKCDFQSAVQSDLKQHIQTNHEVKIKAIHPRQ